MDKAEILAHVRTQMSEIDGLRDSSIRSLEFKKWHRDTEVMLSHSFGVKSKQRSDFLSVQYVAHVRVSRASARLVEQRTPEAFHAGLEMARVVLESIVTEVERFHPDPPAKPAPSKYALDLDSFVFGHLHPTIDGVARKRFLDGHYADAVESAFKAINSIIKEKVRTIAGEEPDGAKLMFKAFGGERPLICLADLSTESGRNIQQGYAQLFAGAMIGIRNPKAHDNLEISKERAVHFLFLASLLMLKFDERL